MHRFAALWFLSLATILFAGPARADTPTILVDGSIARTDVPAIIVDGHVLVPLRDIFERFGAAVSSNPATGIAIARHNGITVKIAVGSSVAWVDGTRLSLDTPAREFAGRIEVPLRLVADALGVSVDYDPGTNTVVIVSGVRPGNFVAAGPGTPTIASLRSGGYASLPRNAQPPSVDERRPTPNSLVGTQYPQIYARFSGGASAVDPGTVRVLLDGEDVTNSATVSSAYVAYTPAAALQGGTHTVQISGQADDGTPFDEQWSFRIESDYSSSYVSSLIGYAPPAFGYRRFGFFPPGFSVFAPGPQFFFEDEPIIIVFFSPFFPSGNGFFTVSGMPGQFGMTPWLGCPGFFWGSFNVPAGIIDPDAVVGAHFTTIDGRTVIVHSTAPLHLDGTRRTIPSTIRYAVRARLVNKPQTPRALVAFRRIQPVSRITPIARRVTPVSRHVPVVRTIPIARSAPSIMHPIPVMRLPAPVIIPRLVPVTMPRVVQPPAPVIIPRMPAPQPQPVPIPHKPPT
jgi:hypothetical protein